MSDISLNSFGYESNTTTQKISQIQKTQRTAIKQFELNVIQEKGKKKKKKKSDSDDESSSDWLCEESEPEN